MLTLKMGYVMELRIASDSRFCPRRLLGILAKLSVACTAYGIQNSNRVQKGIMTSTAFSYSKPSQTSAVILASENVFPEQQNRGWRAVSAAGLHV